MRQLVAIVLFAVLLIAGAPPAARADLQALDDAALDRVRGQAGVAVAAADVRVYGHWQHISWQGSDQGRVDLLDVTLGDGNGKAALWQAGTRDANGDGRIDPLSVDVGAAGPFAAVRIQAPDLDARLQLDAADLAWCGQSLGPVRLGPVHLTSMDLSLGGHGDGLDLAAAVRLDAGAFSYTYNDDGSRLAAEGIHLAGDFAAHPGDDPADPATWQGSGLFRVGDMAAAEPATLDVGAFVDPDTGDNLAAVALELPIQGSLRIEQVSLGAGDFGPAVIDGIRVHTLRLYLVP